MNIFNRYGRAVVSLAAVTLGSVICVSGCAATANQNTYPTTSQTTNAGTTPETSPGSTAPAPASTPVGNTGDNAYNTAPKPKAAVYIMGNPQGRDALRMAVNTFLVKSGRYQMVAVDAIDVVAQEQKRQMSGSVSDEQIAKLGYDAGAQYVCVVERTELDGFSYVATRMVSVENKVAEFADMVKLPHGGDIIEFIQWQIGSMLGMAVGPRPSTVPSAVGPTSQPVTTQQISSPPVSQTTTASPKTKQGIIYNGNGHSYELFNQTMGWTDAKRYCERLGGYLATITSPQEQTFIENLLTRGGNKNMYWLGGYTTGGFRYQWVTGESFVYNNWNSGSGTLRNNHEDKLMIYRVDNPAYGGRFGLWEDDTNEGQETFYKNTGFICEWE